MGFSRYLSIDSLIHRAKFFGVSIDSIASQYLPWSIEIFLPLAPPRYLSIHWSSVLDRSLIPPRSIELRFLYIVWGSTWFWNFSYISISLFSRDLKPSFSPKSLLSFFRPNPSLPHLVSVLYLFLSVHFLGKFWGFYDFVKIFGLGVVKMNSYDHALHSKLIITLFHAF